MPIKLTRCTDPECAFTKLFAKMATSKDVDQDAGPGKFEASSLLTLFGIWAVMVAHHDDEIKTTLAEVWMTEQLVVVARNIRQHSVMVDGIHAEYHRFLDKLAKDSGEMLAKAISGGHIIYTPPAPRPPVRN